MSKFALSSGLIALAATAFACSSPSHSEHARSERSNAEEYSGKSSSESAEEDDDEVAIKLADAPAPVRAAAMKLAPESAIKKVTRESDEGVTVFEIEYVVDGYDCSADVSQDGAIMELEKGVKTGSLPAAARAALEKHFPGAELEKAESVEAFYYEVKVKRDGKSSHVRVYASGAIEENED